MPTFTPDELYDLLRSVTTAEREHRATAERLLQARDWIIRSVDGDPGISRAGLALACGISRQRVSFMLQPANGEQLPESPTVPPELRAVISELRPDLGRFTKIAARA